MSNVLKFERKPPKYTEFHHMSVAKEGDWLVWRCHECSRKVKLHMQTGDMEFERKGKFDAHHTFQCYQPTEQEFKEAGMEPVEIQGEFSFT